MRPASRRPSLLLALFFAVGCSDPTQSTKGFLYVQIYAEPGAPPPIVQLIGPGGFILHLSASGKDTLTAGSYQIVTMSTLGTNGTTYIPRPNRASIYVPAGGYAVADSIKYCSWVNWQMGCPP